MKLKLSHSQAQRHMMCQQNYKYHYIDRLRPTTMAASLIFGSAVDAGISALLSGKDSPEYIFEQSFQNTTINDVATYVPTSIDVVYAAADYDHELLTEDDWREANNPTDKQLDSLFDKKEQYGYAGLTDDEKRLFNLLSWLSLHRKGLLMLGAFRKKVVPKIKNVLALQEYIEIENQDGDAVVGYVDLVAEMHDGTIVVFDIKTSASEYAADSVLSSSQLALYVHALSSKYGTRKAGFIVLRKQIAKNRKKKCSKCGNDGTGGRHKTCDAVVDDKRCNGSWIETLKPDVHVQILVNDMPERTENLVIENLDTINASIKTGCFTRNLTVCSNWYGQKCSYYSKCHKGKDDGLITVKEREKK